MADPTPTTAARRKHHTLGPGTFVLGSVGTQLDISCQLTEIKFAAEAESEDSEMVLCGDTVSGSRNYKWTVSGTLFQDIEASGVIDFTWKHAGTEMPFKFVPDAASLATVTGRVTVDPIEYGGTVGQKNKSDFEWEGNGVKFDPIGNGPKPSASNSR